MSRYHWWGFIVNEAGEPIENAEVTVKIAGGDDLASVYYDEFGTANSTDNPALSAGPLPQLSTLSNGYYEFWIGDITTIHGYRNETKFKIEWQRLGVAHGMVDWINVFPLGPQTDPISLNSCMNPSKTFNKLVSDYYACGWEIHKESEIVLPSGQFNANIHGLEYIVIDPEVRDIRPNKVISNYYGWHWEEHRYSTVQAPADDVDGMLHGGYPHGIREYVKGDGGDIVRNKLVSNADLYNIDSDIENLTLVVHEADTILQNQINDLNGVLDSSKSGWWDITDEWLYDEWDKWYVEIHHDLTIYYPLVQIYEIGTGKMLSVESIEYINENVIRIEIQNHNQPDPPAINCMVRIANGGVHRHPENEEIGGGVNAPTGPQLP